MSESSKLSKLVNFNDLAASEANLRARLMDAGEEETLEIETQLARVMGLTGKYDEALELLASVRRRMKETFFRAITRHHLEEGRCHNDLGHVDEAKRCFVEALAWGEIANDDYLVVDAGHMLAIIGDHSHQIEWGEQVLQWADRSSDTDTRGWAAAIVNNLGWSYFEIENFPRALELFERGVELRKDGPERPLRMALEAAEMTREKLAARG